MTTNGHSDGITGAKLEEDAQYLEYQAKREKIREAPRPRNWRNQHLSSWRGLTWRNPLGTFHLPNG